MDSNQQDKRKWRSDRHKNKTENQMSRSKRNHLMTPVKQKRHQTELDEQKTIKYKVTKSLSQKRTRSDRHQANNRYVNSEKQSRRKRKEKRTNERKRFTFTLKHTILSLGIIFVLALIAYTSIIYGGKLIIDEEKLVISPPTTIETKDGEIIWYLYEEYRVPVDLQQVPEHVQNAFVSIEDKRFYSHAGVDFRSVVRALYRDIVARSKVEGGSTLTQQLAKNLFLTNDKSWLRKIKEAMIALYLEREFTKDEILEMYLNVVYFGQGQYGIEAAANKYFNKSVEDLTLAEGALLAGMVKAPNGYSPIDHVEKAKDRRNVVLTTMSENDYITADEAKVAQEKEVELNITQRKVNPAYHAFVDIAIQEAAELYGISLEELRRSRYRIISSLDETAQTIAFEQFQQDDFFPGKDKEDVEGAFVMMDQETGELVAAIGGRHFKSGDYNRVVRPLGQPGSTMKPIAVYAPALESEQFNPYSILPDELQDWDGIPVRNYNNQYDGEVSFYNALINSKNTSSVWLLNEIGIDYAKSYLKKMNIHIEDNNVRIALGGLKEGISPLQLVESYRTFVHGGEIIEAHAIVEIVNRDGETVASADPTTGDVFSDQVAWNMTEMLRQVVQSGTGQSGYYPHELAGKTGTTQHPNVEGKSKDAWFVGYTPEYVTALWMGYDDISEENHYLTGGSAYPTQLTKKILTEMDQQKSLITSFTKPEHVQALAEPIELPVINDLSSSFVFGGLKIIKGKLQWTGTEDKRVVYRIYEENGNEHKQIGEVHGEYEFIIDKFSLFDTNSYFVVPYDPLTEKEGEASNVVQLSF